jgi:hypothetical protein
MSNEKDRDFSYGTFLNHYLPSEVFNIIDSGCTLQASPLVTAYVNYRTILLLFGEWSGWKPSQIELF